MSGKKYFVLMEGGNDTTQVFVSKQPRVDTPTSSAGSAGPTRSTASRAGLRW